jgi:hypothetical protein
MFVRLICYRRCFLFPTFVLQNNLPVLKKILIAVMVVAVIGVCTGIFMWYKPHKKVENATGIIITAAQLSREYTANEKDADVKYLNKAIEVSGPVSEIDTNQDGGLMVILQTASADGGVQCALRDKNVKVAKGENITVKGFCSGNTITGVSLTDCIIK